MGITAAVAAITVAAGSATYTAVQAQGAKHDAEQAASDQKRDEDAAIAKQQKEQDDQQTAAANMTQRAQARTQMLNSGSAAPNSTILTSPLGSSTPPNQSGGKTLLGG